jgi:hypothetical protein
VSGWEAINRAGSIEIGHHAAKACGEVTSQLPGCSQEEKLC